MLENCNFNITTQLSSIIKAFSDFRLVAQIREEIEKVKAYIGKRNRALIPKEKTYYQQLRRYENQLAKADIHKAHGLRHAYAQRLYRDLTGWDCPAKGGPTKKMLSQEQLQIDIAAREKISIALGHERLPVVAIYCGQ